MGRPKRILFPLLGLTLLFGSLGAPPTSNSANENIASQRFTVAFESIENYRERPKMERASRSSERSKNATHRCDSSCEITSAERRNALSTSQVKGLIVKLARKYGASETRALKVAECESGLDETEYNEKGCEGYGCAGVFQQHLKYWKTRAARYGHKGASPFNPYANISVSMQMAAADGWEHWKDCLY